MMKTVSLSLLLVLAYAFPTSDALMIGRRRIKCSTPIGGNEEVDALMDTRPNLPCFLGYVGFQALLPTLGKCPTVDQFQPPWFDGIPGGGLCPPQYYNLAASAPGLVIIGAAVAWNLYNDANRLAVTKKGIGTMTTKEGMAGFEETVLFKDIEEWSINPLGLVVKSSETNFFQIAWDTKSLEALLEERIPDKKK